MITTRLARAASVFLLVCGLALLFASDAILPRIAPNFPESAAWVGQLAGAGCLAMAALDWLSQSALLGGIYGRPVVAANAAFHFIGGMVLLRAAMRSDAPAAMWMVVMPILLLAGIYGWLLFRGPLERDFQRHGRAAPKR